MNTSKRVIAMFLCMAMVLFAFYTAMTGSLSVQEEEQEKDNDSLVVWYTDDTLSDYINAACVSYNELYGVRVIPRLQSGDEYLERINDASIKDEGTPDVYIISNDMLERAYLGGLATKIAMDNTEIGSNFPRAAKQAVTYKENFVAYPFYFETSAFIYNRSYLYEMASNKLMADESTEPGEEVDGGSIETEGVDAESSLSTEEKIENRIHEAIPKTFEELMEFANEFDAPPAVETIFKWDVKDIFYNYFFVGNYMDVGGENGDDSSLINIYNMDVITALTVYQDFNQFFSFEYEDVSYDSVVQDFIDGKLVFATATSDILKKLETAKAEGNFEFEYGVEKIPNLNDNLISRSLSVTSTVAVNGFSNKKDTANSFAKYLTIAKAGDLYEMSGKLSACSAVTYNDELTKAFFREYAESRPIPKMMATSNYWLLAEIAFSNIWSGKNVSSEVKNLSEQIKEQVTGVIVSEEYIDVPDSDKGDIEYLDEDALRQEAQEEDSESDN